MTHFRLTRDIYTVHAIDEGICAFSHHCSATVEHGPSESVLTLAANEETVAAEFLNYILAMSAQELLS